MVNNSTNINKTNDNLSHKIIEHEKRHYVSRHQPRSKNVAAVNPLMGPKAFLSWVSDCCLTPTPSVYHGENKFIFNEMMMRSALYETNTIMCVLIVLAQWNSPRIEMSLHSETLSWSRSNQACSFSLMMCASWRSNTCQFHSRWFEPLGTRTHNLPRLRWAR